MKERVWGRATTEAGLVQPFDYEDACLSLDALSGVEDGPGKKKKVA
jgi:hypothetical protein